MDEGADYATTVADIVSKHSGLGVLRRLLHLAKLSEQARPLAVEAMVSHIKAQSTPNLTYYQHLVGEYGVQADSAWLEQIQAETEQSELVHERQLNIATANQSRDNIRVRRASQHAKLALSSHSIRI